ncbi:DUF1294 domain-containing protein [Hydrogenophaga sp. T2]|uniref:DUF1294 domain-containing protein n=1 Tax=Hydrogenophaga sp. T2 TaxID=3132823 RepID=UPI003CED6D5F
MRLDGKLKTWNDDRGFGFIQPVHGGQEIFVHIKAFPGGSGRPVAGQALTFEVETAPDGKKRARAVQYPVRSRAKRSRRGESPAPWTIPRLLALPMFIGAVVYMALQAPVKPLVYAIYAAMSALAFLAYALDKSAATRGRWRTPESTLHLLGLAGGWPGALLAQQLLRHKTSKPAFVSVFWVTVVVNIGLFAAWHLMAPGLQGLPS